MTARDFTERDIHLALDGELPAEERAAFESWLDSNPEMKARGSRYDADGAALRAAFAGVLEEPLPARFTDMVAGKERVSRVRRSPWWQAAAAAALLAVGGAGGFAVGTRDFGFEDPAGDRLAEEAVAAHAIYASEKRHAVEVPASDKEHMQTWLSARLGLRLVAPDLTADGFQLVGGRLLPAGESKAAMLLYEDEEGNRISLFVTGDLAATPRAPMPRRTARRRFTGWTRVMAAPWLAHCRANGSPRLPGTPTGNWLRVSRVSTAPSDRAWLRD